MINDLCVTLMNAEGVLKALEEQRKALEIQVAAARTARDKALGDVDFDFRANTERDERVIVPVSDTLAYYLVNHGGYTTVDLVPVNNDGAFVTISAAAIKSGGLIGPNP